MSRKRRKSRKRPERRFVQVITEAEAGFPYALERRNFARNILRDYETPPPGGTLVPRAWVEEHRAELEAAAR